MARGSVNIGGKNYDADIAGIIGQVITFSSDYKIVTETRDNSDTLVTTFNDDGTIVEVFTQGSNVMTKTTTFNLDGSISEVIS